MQFRIDRQPPSIADMAQRRAAHLSHEGIRPAEVASIPPDPTYLARPRADDPARSRSDHSLAYVLTMGAVTRFNVANRWPAMWGLSSARVQFGRQTAAGLDQQAGQPFPAHVAGGIGAGGSPV